MDGGYLVAELVAVATLFSLYFIVSVFFLVRLLVGRMHPPFGEQFKTQVRRIWAITRQVVGWTLIVIGILGMILPGPGIPFFVLGVLLVGRRNPLLRRGWVILRLRLRSLARRPGIIGRSAQLGRRTLQQVRSQIRPLLRKAGPSRRR